MEGPLHLNKLKSPSSNDTLCQVWLKLALSGSGEEDFKISSMYYHYFVIISPWKTAGSKDNCAKFG